MKDDAAEPLPADFYGYRPLPQAPDDDIAARWWDANAADYLAEHGRFLGDADFVWCPEGLREADAQLLGSLDDLRGENVLEIGAGAAQCSRWLTAHGIRATATDISPGMIAAAGALDGWTGISVPAIVADARTLPFGDASHDVVFTAYGALPFVEDAAAVHTEVARVLRPGGRWVFSVTHPIRWAFPDDPSDRGLSVSRSYFDRTPYVETSSTGHVEYVEHHRTLGDHVRQLRAAGFILDDLIEPEWPAGNENVWGGWSPTRGAVLPGTAIFVCRR